MNPTVSVIMPVYNAEQFLSRAIHSVLNQTFRDWELVMVDDGSTDRSGAIMDAAAASDARIHCFHTENHGAEQARSIAYQHCKGEYVAFLDNDDCLHPQMYELLIDCAISNAADMVFCKYYPFTDYSDAIAVQSQPLQKSTPIPLQGDVLLSQIDTDFYGYGWALWNKLYKKSFLRRYFPSALPEDFGVVLRLLTHNPVIFSVPECLHFYYYRPDSVCHTKKCTSWTVRITFQWLQLAEEFYHTNPTFFIKLAPIAYHYLCMFARQALGTPYQNYQKTPEARQQIRQFEKHWLRHHSDFGQVLVYLCLRRMPRFLKWRTLTLEKLAALKANK